MIRTYLKIKKNIKTESKINNNFTSHAHSQTIWYNVWLGGAYRSVKTNISH